MEAKEVKGLWEAYVSVYTNLSESHFKVGDKVICKKSGMKGEVVKLDKPDGAEDEKYYTVEREDGKKMKYAPNELKSAGNGGASKEAETKFHTKLDKLVHKTFGSSPEEEKMKEEVEIDEDAGIISGLAGLALGAKGASYAAKHTKRMRDYPKNFVKGIVDPRTYVPQKKKEQKEEFDIFDVILEHLVAEGYAETNEAALVIMANMSEEWREEIIEGKKEFPHKKVDRQVYDAMDSGETAGDSGNRAKEKRDYARAEKMRSVAAKHGGKTRG
jgi:hypothetical protein